jgi:hypothetical protein
LEKIEAGQFVMQPKWLFQCNKNRQSSIFRGKKIKIKLPYLDNRFEQAAKT